MSDPRPPVDPTPAPVRWGIVSTGHIAGVLADNLALLDDHVITGVSSRDRGRAEAFAADKAPGAAAYGSIAELAAAPDVDIAYVATPHNSHHADTVTLIDGGKAVLCEKPITVNAPQAADLFARAEQAGVFLMEAMWMRTNPLHLRLLQQIRDGAIGEVRAVSARLGFPVPKGESHRLRNPGLAGGALLDMGIYPVTFAYALLGRPTSVQAVSVPADTGDVDGITGVQLGYPDAVATLSTSIEADLPPTGIVMGTEGYIEAEAFHANTSYTVHRFGAEPVTERITWPGTGYTYEAEEAARGLREGWRGSQLIPPADTVAVMEILDECRRQIGLSYGTELESFVPLGGGESVDADPTRSPSATAWKDRT